MRKFKNTLQKISVLFVVVALVTSCQKSQPKEENVVIEFLGAAELQIETQDQLKELEKALKDILELQASQLQEKRYSDYQMHEGVWTLPEILSAYFVPEQQSSLAIEHFYSDVISDSARSLIRKKLIALKAIKIDTLY